MVDLKSIKDPAFLKTLDRKELEALSEQIRAFLINYISETGGHLSSNLGIVELTIALHKVFDSPKDKLIFDVGHQSYVHKILTGRAKDFHTLRKFNGLSGYIKRSESVHDIYEAGHSSTSLAAAAGIEFSKKYLGNSHKVIPIIGDGALTGGMAFEALNFLGNYPNHQPIIILNDNEMSISQNIGYLARIFNQIRSKAVYRKVKAKSLKLMPNFLRKFSSKVERGVKGFVSNNTLFDDFGFSYYGPINGHNFKELIKYLNMAKKANKPCVVHVLTEKGKGYKFSETDVVGQWHGTGPFTIESGEPLTTPSQHIYSWSKIISHYLIHYKKQNPHFNVVVPAMLAGSALLEFQEIYPDSIEDVGIAEQMAVTMSSGYAISGIDVFTPIYSTFIQRAYDQVNHDVCRQNLKVVFGIDRAGIVGADGETHQGIYDIPLLRHLPNMTIGHPRNATEAYKMLNYAFKQNKGPFAIRYERGKTNYDFSQPITSDIIEPKWEILKTGSSATFIGFGSILEPLKREITNAGLDVCIIDAKFIKPLDETLLKTVLSETKPIIIYEESSLLGGFGSSILEYATMHNLSSSQITLLGLPDEFIQHGSKEELLKHHNLDVKSVIKTIEDVL
ncbi:MAG: 1-deoxy-D-xylulose-5-phosphate synthase [Candidatus Izimaplasma sp.]|nr:1-deoxy-D-xylulose-5-phosphate synthase [Candidatus Izimaplasma bacterium]